MITSKELDEYGWFSMKDDRNRWFYDCWEYEYRIATQELFYINDGMDEEYINKITDIDKLINTYYALEHCKIQFKAMKKIR